MSMNRNPTGRGGFQPGQSGNPGGRPKEVREVKTLARERTARAIDVLSRIMDDPKAPSAARVAAARELLDRGHGRAESSLHAKIESADTTADFSVLTPDELDIWHRGSAMLAPLIAKVFGQEAGDDNSPTLPRQ
jgi:Family of unknown function (DUF5681)